MLEHQLLDAPSWRMALWWRQGGSCASCWAPLGALEGPWHAHHRQRRRVLGNCPCNGVALHASCHVQGDRAVHHRPEWAQEVGLIVPAWHDSPAAVPVTVRWPWPGEALLGHDGSVVSPTTELADLLRAEAPHP